MGRQESQDTLYSKHPTPKSLVPHANFRERFLCAWGASKTACPPASCPPPKTACKESHPFGVLSMSSRHPGARPSETPSRRFGGKASVLSLLPDIGDRASSLVMCFAGGHPKACCAYRVGAGAGVFTRSRPHILRSRLALSRLGRTPPNTHFC